MAWLLVVILLDILPFFMLEPIIILESTLFTGVLVLVYLLFCQNSKISRTVFEYNVSVFRVDVFFHSSSFCVAYKYILTHQNLFVKCLKIIFPIISWSIL